MKKHKNLVYADLNFVSQHSLETIATHIEQLQHDKLTTQLAWMDDDKALFQVELMRANRATAQVTGRLQRWAGDMTHIYCDGRVFSKISKRLGQWIRRAAVFIFALPLTGMSFWCSASMITNFTEFQGGALIMWIIILLLNWRFTFYLESIGFGSDTTPDYQEAKDREILLNLLTQIIRDDHSTAHLREGTSAYERPLTEEELLILTKSGKVTGTSGEE